MPYGWTGVTLEVNLSGGTIEKKETDRRLHQDYLGGRGINVKILWDRVPPEVAPFSPDNLLIVGTGILAGSIVPSANRTIITYKSPLTNILACSSMGGFFAPELKHAGYDTIVISGKSPHPVYLWINNDHVEIRDASHLWGKDTHETQRLLRKELKNDRSQIMCIGQAGENLVYCASIEHGTGASVSRAGVGAVMGDKKLKAVAVYGTNDINIARPDRLVELCEQILSRTDPQREMVEYLGRRLVESYTAAGGFGNFDGQPRSPELQQKVNEARKIAQDFIDTKRIRDVACYNCGLRCKHVYHLAEGYSFIKCSAWVDVMLATKIIDSDFNIAFYNLVEKYGLDSRSITSIIAFAIDLYQRGILTRKDTGGMALEWGKPEVAFHLLEKIVRREGIGDVLANGVYRAARQIGRGAEQYAHHTKKMETDKVIMRAPHYVLMEAVADRGDHARLNNMMLGAIWPRSREEREAYIKNGFFIYPKEYEKYLLSDYDFSGDDLEGMVRFVAYNEETYALTDITGLCAIWTVFLHYPPINSRPLFADLISKVTGVSIDEAELTKILRREITLVRAYNVREGIRRKDDRVPDIHYRVYSPKYRPDRDKLAKWIDKFYELNGYNRDGIPTRETLEELGLEEVSRDLEQRGLLKS